MGNPRGPVSSFLGDTNLRGGQNLSLDIDDPATAEAKAVYQFRYQPTYVLLDANGKVVNSWLGRQDKGVFDAAFAAVLGQ